jgi:hypothetical protein
MPLTSTSPASDLDRFIARYTPNIDKLARGALARMRKHLPTAHQLGDDNYNTCAIGFSPTERASDVIFSIALYPQQVSLFFLRAMKSNLQDPQFYDPSGLAPCPMGQISRPVRGMEVKPVV